MKSCLKSPTPPLSPYPSAPPTPGECPPRLQKTVSFCEDDELEEVFEVDEWDRSPAPVTPRLSYDDVLELKRLRLTLPRPAPPPTSRQPYTTSSPTAYTAAASRPFPLSRFASQPSQTPSKWKNRGTTPDPGYFDADILPYLDAVPIRLLPLLDTPAAPEPPSPQLLAEAEPIARADPPSQLHPTSSPPPQPSPAQTPPSPPSAPSPPSLSISPPPLQIPSSSPSTPPAALPSSPSTPTATPASSRPPPRRLPTFSFLPLLPVQRAAPSPPSEPVRPPAPPQRRINMTFLPLVAPPSPPSVPPQSLPEPTPHPEPEQEPEADLEPELAPTPTLAPIREPSPPEPGLAPPSAAGPESPIEGSPNGGAEESTDEEYNDLPARALSPTDLSTPALSSASESDTDEHDGDTDADADDDGHHGRGLGGHAHPALAQYEYFAARLQPSGAGQTPPLSSIYPEVQLEEAGAGLGLGVGLGRLPFAMQGPVGMAALKKVQIAALPSPALAPPSPFSLYPPSPGVGGGGSPFVPREFREVGERSALVMPKRELRGLVDGHVKALEVEIGRLAVAESREVDEDGEVQVQGEREAGQTAAGQ
ncbi:uncharacterized protein C8Q71DRAFT_471301 [Rhodofomes roseus]|uniref:Uncharacterized protein n=1 Tax=Rhodofomes roseus TaxID=34475 RepID=A0ABQ8KNH7_9APHY|nr:uncharacterized protein C8Q71DRAFT_471301 [Rhodofomes roseus]KAH9839973.1 hypothetical protein C8Q71DRAFT_471301 [Rhodofomes roseus]